jgi:hypothetical protein
MLVLKKFANYVFLIKIMLIVNIFVVNKVKDNLELHLSLKICVLKSV